MRLSSKYFIYLTTIKGQMKYLIYISLFIFISQLNAQSYSLEQGRADFQRNRNSLTKPIPTNTQKYFDILSTK